MDENLIQFIEHARAKGLGYSTIRQLLLSVGWKDKQIAEVLGRQELELPIPIPPTVSTPRPAGQRKKGSVWPRRARDAFLHLLMFGALYTTTTSVVLLLFTYIDFAFPDPARRVSHARILEAMSFVRAELAIIIVSFPIFLALWHYLLRETRNNPEKGGIRRWIGYLSVFIGALTIAGDVMTLIFFLLEGQLTTALAMKSIVLLFIAGSLVLYLGYTLKTESQVGPEL